jgi:hypothetical protein
VIAAYEVTGVGVRPGREWFVAGAVAVVLAVAMIWLVPPYVVWAFSGAGTPPSLADPVHTIVGDGGDPTGQAWQIAWNGYALRHGLHGLWNTNAFYPDTYGLAFTDSLLGYAPAGLFGSGPDAAVLRYNIVFVLAFALASFGGYVLARQLGATWAGAAVTGIAFAYAPWRYGHDGHLNILSTGGIALALAMLARGHGFSFTRAPSGASAPGGSASGGGRPRRPGWALAGWVVAAWQVSLGFGIGLAFAYLLLAAVVVAVVAWFLRGRPALGRRLILADLGGGLFFVAVTGYFASVYQHVRVLHPEIPRSWEYVALFSPTWRGLVTAPRPSLLWGDWHEPARTAMGNAPNEKVLLCGFLLCSLAAAGLVASVWTARQRLLLGAGVVLGVLLALGTNGPLYRLLFLYLPGFDGIRTPGRLIVWPTLLLGLLAAGFLSHLTGRAGRALAVVLLIAVTIEGMPKLDHMPPSKPPEALAVAQAPLMVLPSDEGVDLNVQLWSTAGFPTMVNGAAGIITPGHTAIRELMRGFPSPASQERLRQMGVRSVVVVRDRIVGTPFEPVLDAPPTPGVTRRDIGDDILYTLD